jgi:hypothetical protein
VKLERPKVYHCAPSCRLDAVSPTAVRDGCPLSRVLPANSTPRLSGRCRSPPFPTISQAIAASISDRSSLRRPRDRPLPLRERSRRTFCSTRRETLCSLKKKSYGAKPSTGWRRWACASTFCTNPGARISLHARTTPRSFVTLTFWKLGTPERRRSRTSTDA